jgi:hypothetical protein
MRDRCLKSVKIGVREVVSHPEEEHLVATIGDSVRPPLTVR